MEPMTSAYDRMEQAEEAKLRNSVALAARVDAAEGSSVTEPDQQFDVLVDVERRLTEMTTVMQAKGFADEARTLQVYAQRAKKGLEVQNRCALVRILAEQRAGQLLAQLEREPGRREDGETSLQRECRLANLADSTARRWHVMARVPFEVVKKMWEQADIHGKELLSGPVYTLGQQIELGRKRADLSGRVGNTQQETFDRLLDRLARAIPDYHELLPCLPINRLGELHRGFKDLRWQVDQALTHVARQTQTEMEDVLVPHVWPPKTGEDVVKDFGKAVRVFAMEAEVTLNSRVLLTEVETLAQLNTHLMTAREVLNRVANLVPAVDTPVEDLVVAQ